MSENKDWEFNHIEVKRDLKNFVTTLIMDHPPISEKEARIKAWNIRLPSFHSALQVENS